MPVRTLLFDLNFVPRNFPFEALGTRFSTVTLNHWDCKVMINMYLTTNIVYSYSRYWINWSLLATEILRAMFSNANDIDPFFNDMPLHEPPVQYLQSNTELLTCNQAFLFVRIVSFLHFYYNLSFSLLPKETINKVTLIKLPF